MKTRCAVYALCFAALGAVLVPQVMAVPIPCPVLDGVDTIIVRNPGDDWRYNNGGLFHVQYSDDVADQFVSFCLEKYETLNFGKSYTFELSDSAIGGGVGGGPDGDLLDYSTAFLYSKYFNETLATAYKDKYGVTIDDKTLSKALQKAIWSLEDEETIAEDSDLATEAMKLILLAADANANSLYGVLVMNLMEDSQHRQSILVCCECQPIPEPSTMAIWGLLGVCGLMIARRRRK